MYMFGMDMLCNFWIIILKIFWIFLIRNYDFRLFIYIFNDKIYRYLNWFFLIYRLFCWYFFFFIKIEYKCGWRLEIVIFCWENLRNFWDCNLRVVWYIYFKYIYCCLKFELDFLNEVFFFELNLCNCFFVVV